MILKGIIYGVIILILLIITLIFFIAFIKNKKHSLIYFIVSLLSSILFIFYTVFVVFEKIKREVNSEIENSISLVENSEDTTTTSIVELTDGLDDTIIEIDDLFSGFAHDNENYEGYYLNRKIIVEGRVDTLIKNCERKINSNCLVLYVLTGTKYDVGYFLFDNDVIKDLEKLKTDEIVRIEATITEIEFSGMLGVDLVFEDCRLIVNEDIVE